MVYWGADSGAARRPYTDADIVGAASWPPIVPEPAWRAVCAILTDPARTVGPGGTPKWNLDTARRNRCGSCWTSWPASSPVG